MRPTKKNTNDNTDPIAAALTAKLTALLRGPLTPRTLLEMEKTARLGRELLVVGKNPEALSKKPGLGVISYVGNPMYESALDSDGTLTPAPPMETFGANALREIMAALPALMPKPAAPIPPSMTELIMGIAYAKKQGLDELAKQLEDKLMDLTGAPALLKAPKALKSGDGVYINAVGPNMISVIKVVREFTGWGLKDAKDFVDQIRKHENDEIPLTRRMDNVVSEQFDECAAALRKAGAKVSTVRGGEAS